MFTRKSHFVVLLLSIGLQPAAVSSPEVSFLLQQSSDLDQWNTFDVVPSSDFGSPGTCFMRIVPVNSQNLSTLEKLEPGTRLRANYLDHGTAGDFLFVDHDTYIDIEADGDLGTGKYRIDSDEQGDIVIHVSEATFYEKPGSGKVDEPDDTYKVSNGRRLELDGHGFVDIETTVEIFSPSRAAPDSLSGLNAKFYIYEEASSLAITADVSFGGYLSNQSTFNYGNLVSYLTFIYSKDSDSTGTLKMSGYDARGKPYLTEIQLIFHDESSGYFLGFDYYSDGNTRIWGFFGSNLPLTPGSVTPGLPPGSVTPEDPSVQVASPATPSSF